MINERKFKYLDEIPSLVYKHNIFNNHLNEILGNQIYFTKIDIFNKCISSSNIYDSYFEDLYINKGKIKKLFIKYCSDY